MSAVPTVGEADLVWAAAVVEGVDPAALSATVDVAALAVVVAEAEGPTDPVEAAAALLVAMVRRRPFPTSNAAAGWLALVELLAASQRRVEADPASVVALCDAIGTGAADPAEVAVALRGWTIEEGLACPTCGRRVYTADPVARRLMTPVDAPFELTARCALEHGSHDRSGRPFTPPPRRRVDRSQPILARGDCGSFLVAEEAGTVAVSPFCDDPPIVRVVAVDELHPGDLAGRWDALVERSTTLGFVAAHLATPDDQGRVDVLRLRRALRAEGIGVGAFA